MYCIWVNLKQRWRIVFQIYGILAYTCINREVKHDVYGKQQTAKMRKPFAISPELCVQLSEIICICNE